jgi:hypothetical protein
MKTSHTKMPVATKSFSFLRFFLRISIPVLKSSVAFSWHVTDGKRGLGATAGLSSSVFYPCAAGQASSGARKSIGNYFRELLYSSPRFTAEKKYDCPAMALMGILRGQRSLRNLQLLQPRSCPASGCPTPGRGNPWPQRKTRLAAPRPARPPANPYPVSRL